MSTLKQKTTGLLTTAFLTFCLILNPSAKADDKLPDSGKNNVWYTQNDADTVVVFVHGVLSDSRGAWAQEDNPNINWPKLIDQDEVLEGPSIFLGGFYTAIDSGNYDMRDAANELHRNLVVSGVLKKQKIIFITHSTGGIVVRHMLVRNNEKFVDKKVGLVLIASPSLGSRDADRLNIITRLARHRLGQELQWDNPFLRELDKDFKNLVNDRGLPGLIGTEWLENHYVGGELGRLFGLARDEVLVEEDSAARYFGEPIRLPNTTHTTAVKPADVDHPTHMNLRFFYLDKFLPAAIPAIPSQSPFNDEEVVAKLLDRLNESINSPDEETSRNTRKNVSLLISQFIELSALKENFARKLKRAVENRPMTSRTLTNLRSGLREMEIKLGDINETIGYTDLDWQIDHIDEVKWVRELVYQKADNVIIMDNGVLSEDSEKISRYINVSEIEATNLHTAAKKLRETLQ